MIAASPSLVDAPNPFGALEESRIGRENAMEGRDVHLETKAVSLTIQV